jgi:hypothetical protein
MSERTGEAWGDDEEAFVVFGFTAGVSTRDLAGFCQRTVGAIESRLAQHGLGTRQGPGYCFQAVKIATGQRESAVTNLRNLLRKPNTMIPTQVRCQALNKLKAIEGTDRMPISENKDVELMFSAESEREFYRPESRLEESHLQFFNHPTEKEETMTAKNIETRTYIHGNNAADMTDSQIFEAIRQLENRKASLEGIKAKPAKLKAQLADIDKDIAAMVAYVDNRTSEA